MINKDELIDIRVLRDLLKERNRQEKIHPHKLKTSDMYFVLLEEIGEVAEALQHSLGLPGTKHEDKDDLYEELIQVAAVAVRMANQVIQKQNDAVREEAGQWF